MPLIAWGHSHYWAGVPGGPQTVSPSSIASLEAFGAGKVNLLISPSAIGSAEAIGTASLRLLVSPTSIASAQAFGEPVVTGGAVIVEVSRPGQHIASLRYEFDTETGQWVLREELGPDLRRILEREWDEEELNLLF